MIYTREDVVKAFHIGWESRDDYDHIENALEEFVGKLDMKTDEAEERYKKGYVDGYLDHMKAQVKSDKK